MSVWGDVVPAWLESVSTLGALIAATFAVRAANRTNKQQSAQIAQLEKAEADRVERDKREQAAAVAMWFASEGMNTPRVMYSNRSGLPIYDVRVIVQSPWGNTFTNLSTLGPTSEPTSIMHVLADVIASGGDNISVPPGEKYYYLKNMNLPDGSKTWAQLINGGHLRLGFAFRDVNEVPWFRTPYGELAETGMLGAAVARLAESMGVII